MRFLITMNMPSRQGSFVHQIIGEHPANSLDDFIGFLHADDFIVVEEYYKDHKGNYYNTGGTILNHRYIGKVRLFSNDTHVKKHDGE